MRKKSTKISLSLLTDKAIDTKLEETVGIPDEHK